MTVVAKTKTLSVDQAARRIGRKPETVRRWIRHGALPAQRQGQQYIIHESALKQFERLHSSPTGQTPRIRLGTPRPARRTPARPTEPSAPTVPAVGPLTEYVRAAMGKAIFKPLDGEGIWGEIPGLPGPWANAPTEAECRAELQSVLEDWILVGVALHQPIPPIDGLEIRVGQVT